MHEAERGKYLQLGCNYFQNKHANYTSSLRIYKTQNRSFSSSMFVRVLANGEKHDRKWLMYSESTGCVFCYVCKLFSNANSRESKFVKGGFSDWKKATESITSHENSKEHKDCLIIWISRTSATNLIDKELATTIQNETRYWTEILNRVLAVIRFLAERGLAFRGKNEVVGASNNGNYLGALELIAQFDPFLEKHLQMHANKGRGHVSYLSKTICEEFIKILAAKVFTTILSEIKEAKYFGLIVDSTPDLSHIDQLTIVMRYCLKGSIIERFLCFIPIYSHTGESLSTEVLNLLENNSIDICDCRAQTYDNASNMSGKYNGCQALIKEKNELAYYVPCVAHSLNLIGECSVDSCFYAINFFSFLQKLYAFFSASTHRWDVLMQYTTTSVKNLSATRWSCRYDAVSTLKNNFDCVYNALNKLSSNEDENAVTRNEAKSYLWN
ncbi:Zinc finger MYM-type protein 1 [Trachymyrmex cornetzi]|uniref:Zinc finger MYM-type protein 1 n=1 Tax=Trachymyrmex cornetzi TaxID=471704 RepID=A0A151JQM1_9HYME|nr:Zinc finger MYM-type protein 1 [Trachymyrmex cornetzi]